jgi:hypothetical protein
MAQTEYVAGLIDAQLCIAPSKNGSIRVLLTCHEPRVADEIRETFEFTRITTIVRPNKKDMCTCLFLGEHAEALLEFAATHCILKKEVAAKALDVMRGKATLEDLAALHDDAVTVDDETSLPLDWVSGYFDVKSVVVRPSSQARGSVKIVLPKSDSHLIPALQKVISGKVKKTSPCRLVFESKDSIAALVDMVRDRVRVKRQDLDALS